MIIGIENKLQDYITNSSIELADFIELSILLTEMVQREHQQNAVIGGLSPANIHIRGDGQAARLSESTEGHEAYRSPEQSGRINRVPDGRSDLYVLGVIMYELLTGRLPFQPDNGEEWDTAHIHRLPRPLSEIRPDAAGPLQAVILKLLSKSPEDRYQSAYGLLDDLQQCRRIGEGGWKQTSFEFGRMDGIRSFRLPDSSYGRSAAYEQLEAGLEQAFQGGQAFRWVTGSEGVGKTALVHRLQLDVVRSGGWFVEGNIEPLPQARPYGPLLQALRQWGDQLWSEPADVIALLKEKLQTDCGQEARLLVSLLPEVGPLFGIRSEETSAPDAEDGKRVGELLPGLIRRLAAGKPPLVLFIDRLEWADEGTHEVLRALATGAAAPGLFLIGACRTESEREEAPASVSGGGIREPVPEVPWLAERSCTNPAEQVALLPLCYEEVKQYIADATHEATARMSLLARSVYDRTGGNPRTIRLLLERWLQEKKLDFDEKRRKWVWTYELIRQMGDSEAHRRLMEASFAKLPDETKELLAVAAAIGPAFRPSLLSEAYGLAPEAVFRMLQGAEGDGIICPGDETELGNGQERIYLFLHDSVHQMAYAFGAERNTQRHLKIGRLLQSHQPDGDDDPAMLAAIDHLNLGAAVMSEQETRQLAERNLQAGRQVIIDGRGRYAKGRQYAEAGLRLVEEEKKPESGSLYFQLMLTLAWSEYMCSNIEQARKLLLDLKERDSKLSRVERSQIWTPLIQFYTFVENETAVQYGREALSAYGWKSRVKVSKLSILKEVTHTRFLLYRQRDKIHQLPANHDEEYAALCGHMEQISFSLLVTDAGALIELYARFIRYGLRKGMNESLACIIGAYEQIVRRVIPLYTQTVSFAELEFIQSPTVIRSWHQHRLSFIGGLSRQLEKPAEASAYLVKAMRRGLELGDKDFANLTMITYLVTYNGNLYALSDILDFFAAHMQKKAIIKVLQMVEMTKRYIAAMQDESLHGDFIAIPAPDSGDSEHDDEDNYSCGCKLEVAYLFGKYREALYWAKRGRENELAPDWVRIRKQRLYETLTLAALYPEANAAERNRVRRALRAQLGRMKSWKGFLGCDSSAHLLLKAEWGRIAGSPMGALREYMAAIKQARAEKYGLMEGIACERLAVCYQNDLISRSGAMITMMDACTAYSVWGVTSKVVQIRSRHAELLKPAASKLWGEPVLEGKDEDDRVLLRLPQQRAAEESQALTGGDEDKLVRQILDWAGKPGRDNWLASLLESAFRQAGADQGFLLRCTEDGFAVEAQSDMSPHGETSGLYAESVLRHTAATNEPVVLHDALQSYFVKDTYIEARRPRSILCMPIAVPGEQAALLLYLENRQMPGVFTERDVNVLELIATHRIYLKLLEDGAAAARATGASAAPEVATTTGITDTAEKDRAPSAAGTAQQELIEPLTSREIEMLTALAEGLSNRDIAERFSIAETTVKTHMSRVFGKLGVKRRGQAVVRAKELRLID